VRRAAPSLHRTGWLPEAAVQALLALGAAIMVLPMVWMLATSFKPPTEVAVWPPRLLPHAPTLRQLLGRLRGGAVRPVLPQQRRPLRGGDGLRDHHVRAGGGNLR